MVNLLKFSKAYSCGKAWVWFVDEHTGNKWCNAHEEDGGCGYYSVVEEVKYCNYIKDSRNDDSEMIEDRW